MAQLFILRLQEVRWVDEVTKVAPINFLSTTYRVMDGGFDIGLPQVKRELALVREGYRRPLVEEYQWREARIRFDVRGTTRSAVLDALGNIQRLLRGLGSRQRGPAGFKVELAYAWEGAENITYFEVYGGDIRFPVDVLSVAKIHKKQEGVYILPSVEVVLHISPYGYGMSLFETQQEGFWLDLSNDIEGPAKKLTLTNPGYQKYNWVEISGSDLPGGQPYVTQIKMDDVTAECGGINYVYIGHQLSPYPVGWLDFDAITATYRAEGWNLWYDGANRGWYTWKQFDGNPYFAYAPTFKWTLEDVLQYPDTAGYMFYGFWHCYTYPGSAYVQPMFRLGTKDGWYLGGAGHEGQWVKWSEYTSITPLGAVQAPFQLGHSQYGAKLGAELELSCWLTKPRTEQTAVFTLDYISLLPVSNGMRIWLTWASGSAQYGQLIDDEMHGGTVLRLGDYIGDTMRGQLAPIHLEPGVDQRLYFLTRVYSGGALGTDEAKRKFSIQVHAVPTSMALAL